MKKIIIDDILYILGENAIDNFNIINEADKNDWWFHIENHSSAHCIVKTNELTNQIINNASELIKTKSKFKNNKITIIYCNVKHVKKTKEKGQVILLKKPLKKIC